jgi:hypothetical protein
VGDPGPARRLLPAAGEAPDDRPHRRPCLGDRQFLLNPFGLLFEEVTASNLVKTWYKADPFGQLDRDALVRWLDAEDPTYRG